ncbi:DUF3846 domain-containing protein [Mycobacterium riyadhense]|uniref:DUF3846 domain-containing protein n=1 Tax=Mycobacterium riyadhense TaxID=486698 RepID=UPI00195EE08E|nr:DUF3846 domain-containing protein [Mycobacterium riyadhense]
MTNTVQALVIRPGHRTGSHIRMLTTDLNTLQRLVGGYIEVTYGYRNGDGLHEAEPRMTFYLNEEGKIHQLPENGLATALWWHYNRNAIGRDYLVGTVVIIGGAGEAPTLPPDVVDTYNRLVTGEYHTGFDY